jgi:diacylglycerol kinase
MKKFFKSFFYALTGIKTSFKERNFKIHFLAIIFVTFLGFFFSISPSEWGVILLCFGLVTATETINTAIEEICNLLNSKLKLDYFDTWNPRNLGAGAVLLTAIISAIIGAIIFLPKITALIR